MGIVKTGKDKVPFTNSILRSKELLGSPDHPYLLGEEVDVAGWRILSRCLLLS